MCISTYVCDIALHLVGGWRAAVIEPSTWGLGARPSQKYNVKEGTARQLLLRRIQDRDDGNPHGTLRPTIWADAPDDPHSGLRVLFFFFKDMVHTVKSIQGIALVLCKPCPCN